MSASVVGDTISYARLPIANPKKMIAAVNKAIPGVDKWYVQFAELVTSILKVEDRHIVGHGEEPDKIQCELINFVDSEQCKRDSDFLIINDDFK